ncbi:hypothetical protein HYPSUDRAFT_88078 [Hypholoma sublateritium FD-334 SS-4]|uniref:Uncharacterized protein n=1 Tax=Hypholoma sublateritium (strain FD-334 SS-4) TaxID=945553 RepID=A0A0D2NXS5_HYPSF|nr:hypothetical protein HYPSUDRAFT_88078 [Hypholoma sublateritium FD-334 SS-4]
MSPRALEVLFLSLSPRLYTLRALTLCSLLVIYANFKWMVNIWTTATLLYIALYAVIAAQQIISTFKWKLLYGIIDFIFLVVEVIGTGYFAKRVLLKSWVPETYLFLAVMSWIVVGALSLTICFRIADIIHSKGRSLIEPFDILAHESASTQSKSNSLRKGWVSTFQMLFGRSIWRKNFVGEAMSIRAIRGILAIVVLFAVLLYTFLNVIFAPIQETALSPIKSYRVSGVTPYDLLDGINYPTWHVSYRSQDSTRLTSLISLDVFFSAVNVTAIWPDSIYGANDSLFMSNLPACGKGVMAAPNRIPSFYYQCSSALISTDYVLPDLNINIDFDLLISGLSGMVGPARTQLPLVIGLSDDPVDDLIHTESVTIIPGVNMAVSYIIDVRQVYNNGAMAAFGSFYVMRKFWLPRFVGYYPDPAATFTGINRSSLNIFSQANYGELNFIQEYREHSVFDGLASVGGLWTAFGGIFAIIFGASMLHTYNGSKPLSIFGIAHNFQAEAMRKECLERYPQILKEHRSPEHRGLLSLLRDHLINLDFLDTKTDTYIDLQSWDKEEDTMERSLCTYQMST